MTLSAIQQVRAILAQRDMVMPNSRHFTATKPFFTALEQYKGKTFIECGAGCGDTSIEAREYGYDFKPNDLFKRDMQAKGTYICDATILPFDAKWIAIICRPDHSGWCYEVISKQLQAGGVAIYVGLERNFEEDIDDLAGYVVRKYTNVGEEDECMWIFSL